MTRPLAGLALATVVACVSACGDARHEPVKLIAAPRPLAAPEAPAPAPAPVLAVAPPTLPPTLPPSEPARALPRPGIVERSQAQRAWHPGQPNGNADFRSAMDAKLGGASPPAAVPEPARP